MADVIATTNAPAAIGPYSQAVRVGDQLFISGQIPLDPATGELVPGGVAEQARQVFANIRAILEAAGGTLANAVMVTVLLDSMDDFGAVNEVYAEQFTEPFPARMAYAVEALPKGALVEIQVIAAL